MLIRERVWSIVNKSQDEVNGFRVRNGVREIQFRWLNPAFKNQILVFTEKNRVWRRKMVYLEYDQSSEIAQRFPTIHSKYSFSICVSSCSANARSPFFCLAHNQQSFINLLYSRVATKYATEHSSLPWPPNTQHTGSKLP